MKISQGAQVSVEFTMTLEDQTVVGSNVGADPVVLTIGAGEIFPAVEKAMEGMAAEDAFGPVQTDAIHEVERTQIPEDAQQVGVELMAQDSEGVRARVTEVRDDVVVLDVTSPPAEA